MTSNSLGLLGIAAATTLVSASALSAASINLTSAGYTQNFSTFATDNQSVPPDTTVNTGSASQLTLPTGFTIGGNITALNGNGGYGEDTSVNTGEIEYYRGVYADGGPGGSKLQSASPPLPYQSDNNHGAVYALTAYQAGVTTSGGGNYAIGDRGNGARTLELNFAVTNTTGSTLSGLQISYQVQQFSGAGDSPTTVSLYSDNGAGTAGNTTTTDTINGMTQTHLTGVVVQNNANDKFTANGAAFNPATGSGFDVSADAFHAVYNNGSIIEPYGATTANGYDKNSPAPDGGSGPEVATVTALYSNSVAPGATVNFTIQLAPSTAAASVYDALGATGTERGFIGVSNFAINPVGLPEPASLGLIGLVGGGLLSRRQRRA